MVRARVVTLMKPPSYFDFLLTEVKAWEYREILNIAHDIMFKATVPNDINRVADGLELRATFAKQFDGEALRGVVKNDFEPLGESGATLLEVMVGIALRMNNIIYNYEDPDMVGDCFNLLLINLGLDNYTNARMDGMSPRLRKRIMNDIRSSYERVVNREYDAKGYGGFFPLDDPKEDQRGVEIWYQMMAFLTENSIE